MRCDHLAELIKVRHVAACRIAAQRVVLVGAVTPKARVDRDGKSHTALGRAAAGSTDNDKCKE
jgi:hypothetical protein